MADLKSVIEHPAFYNIGWEERRKALDTVSPQFHGLPPVEQNKFIGGLTLEWIAKQDEARQQRQGPADEDPGFWNTLGPAVLGAPRAFMDFVTSHPLDQMLQRNEAIRQKAKEAFSRGDYSTATGLNLAGMIPGSGDQAIQAGEDFGKGHWRAGSANALMALAPFLPWGRAVPGVGARGTVRGALDAATQTVDIPYRGVKIPVPVVLGSAGAGAGAAELIHQPWGLGAVVGGAAPIIRGALKGRKAALTADAMRTARLAAGESPKPVPPMIVPPKPFPSASPEVPGQTPFRTIYPQPTGPARVSLPSQAGTASTPRPVTDFSPIPPEIPGQMPSGRVVGTGQPTPLEPPVPLANRGPEYWGLGKTSNPVIQMAPLPEGGVQFPPRKVRPGVELPEPRLKITDAQAEAELARAKLAAQQKEPIQPLVSRTGSSIEPRPEQRITTPEQTNPAAIPEQITSPPGAASGKAASASHFGDLLDTMFEEPKPETLQEQHIQPRQTNPPAKPEPQVPAKPLPPATQNPGSQVTEPGPNVVQGKGSGVLRDLGRWEDMVNEDGTPDYTGMRLYLNKRFHALAKDIMGQNASGTAVAQELYGPDVTWMGKKPITPWQMDRITRFMAEQETLPTKTDAQTGLYKHPTQTYPVP